MAEPQFFSKNPHVWFFQVEAQFVNAGITVEKTKFNHLIAIISPEFTENILDIIIDEAGDKYSRAKDRLIGIFKESDEIKLKRLTSKIELGDQKPSQLLRKMRQLGGGEITDTALRTFWLEQLPKSIRAILTISSESLEKIAEMADKMIESNRNSDECYSIKNNNYNDNRLEIALKEFTEKMEKNIESCLKLN